MLHFDKVHFRIMKNILLNSDISTKKVLNEEDKWMGNNFNIKLFLMKFYSLDIRCDIL